MKKMITTITYFIILTFVAVLSAEAGGFDPEAISQVSKGIAEWKLMNEEKAETQVGQIVYVSSSLSGMVEKGSGEGIEVINGLSAAIDMKYVPWELRDIAKEIDKNYGGNIHVVVDRTINAPGQFVPRDWYKTGNSTILGPAVIRINPDMIGKYVYYQGDLGKFTYGQVLAHELEHAKDWPSARYTNPNLKEINPMRGDVFYTSQINTKISNNPVRMPMAKIDNYSLKDPFYNVTQKWHLSRVPDKSTLGLPNSYFQRSSNYPPPNILFSTKDPLSTYTSPTFKMPTYSPYSIPKMPTYTPSIPSSSWGRKY